MSPEKAVDIIEEINKKYNITFFHILDDAININFAEKFAKELIERNLKIEYSCLLRTENNLNFELLKILKKSGIIFITALCSLCSHNQ